MRHEGVHTNSTNHHMNEYRGVHTRTHPHPRRPSTRPFDRGVCPIASMASIDQSRTRSMSTIDRWRCGRGRGPAAVRARGRHSDARDSMMSMTTTTTTTTRASAVVRVSASKVRVMCDSRVRVARGGAWMGREMRRFRRRGLGSAMGRRRGLRRRCGRGCTPRASRDGGWCG